MTARHVIGDGREVVAEFPDGRTMRASEVYASSSGLDLAVVRIPDAGLPELRLGTEELITDGRDVVALGHPRGFRYSVVS
ncbi:MAG: trypsin-like peptidase domain-containing protein, partial [Phycisphaerae bacterium]